ncbi:MAG: MoaD/ThiS family protein [Phycisphaerales bacterium]
MIRIEFTKNIQRHVECPPTEIDGAATVADALDAVFERLPQARGYVVDERGRLRKHMNIFVNGEPVKDRETLSDPLDDGAEVYVMQALSGG